jgi:signal transduction histidine kinase
VKRDVTEERLVQKKRDDQTDTKVHDLRNPLTNIRVALELLNQVSADTATPQQRDVLQIASVSTQRMLTLVNAILDVSRLESGQMPLHRRPVDLRALADEVLAVQRPVASEKRLALDNEVPASLPRVAADHDLLSRVLENLLGNAVKFTPYGGCVTVSASALPGEPVRVAVRDTGPGLQPEVKHRLFHKFVSGRHAERGSGLGLAFCRLVVEAHGGRIWADSEPNQGTVVHFTLPTANGHGDPT